MSGPNVLCKFTPFDNKSLPYPLNCTLLLIKWSYATCRLFTNYTQAIAIKTHYSHSIEY